MSEPEAIPPVMISNRESGQTDEVDQNKNDKPPDSPGTEPEQESESERISGGATFRREFNTHLVSVEFRGDFDILRVGADLYDIMERQMTPYLEDLIGPILVGSELSVSFVDVDGEDNVELAHVVVTIMIQSHNAASYGGSSHKSGSVLL